MDIINSVNNIKIDESIDMKPEIRIGVLGNVDSGKSSTIGVITKNVPPNYLAVERSKLVFSRKKRNK